MITQQQFEKDATPTKWDKNLHIGVDYVIGCDPYDILNWWQNLLKKIGFYKNRPKSNVAIFKKNSDGTIDGNWKPKEVKIKEVRRSIKVGQSPVMSWVLKCPITKNNKRS